LNEYWDDPSIEKYVALRRRFPRGDTAPNLSEGFNAVAMKDELTRYGIDPYVVYGAVGGNDRDIDELSLQILEALIRRRKQERAGKTHLQSRKIAISDGLIAYLIMTMLESEDLYIPTSLVVLIGAQLCGSRPERYQHYTKLKKRDDAALLGFLLEQRGEKPTVRRIAKSMDVEPSTVSRWFPGGDIRKEIDRWRRKLKAFDT
jgi:hypothetical protein